MPSGRTHDRITLLSLPVVAALTYAQTGNSHLTLLLAGGFLFGGLMFGPDLDIYSRQYKRWGYFRWIWIPYQKSLRHRSFLSHGPIIGTVVRSLYLLSWILALTWLWSLVALLLWGVPWLSQQLGRLAIASIQQQFAYWFALFLGLELGAMSHSLTDWGNSAWKRFLKSPQGAELLSRIAKIKEAAIATMQNPTPKPLPRQRGKEKIKQVNAKSAKKPKRKSPPPSSKSTRGKQSPSARNKDS